MTNRKLILSMIGIFAFGFCFVYAAYVGLPVDFNADHVNNVKGAESVSYSELARMILNPFTPAWFYPAEGRMEYLRPLQFLLMKFFFETFQYDLVPVHITAAVGHGLLLVVFALIIYFFSGSILFGWLAALLYTSFPSNFFMMVSVFSMDFQYYVSLLSIASLILFAVLTGKKMRQKVLFVTTLMGCFLSVWLAIKLKSSEKILPMIMLLFLVFRLRFILKQIGWRQIVILVLFLACMTPLVAPLKCFERWTPKQAIAAPPVETLPVTEKDKTTFAFQWDNLWERTFFVPGGEFPFTTIHRRKIPRSFTESYGFFLGCIFWAGLAWLLGRLIFYRLNAGSDEVSEKDEFRRHGAGLILLWFLVTIAGFANGINVLDTRLLNFAYVPSVLLFFAIVSFFEKAYIQNLKKRSRFRLILAALVLFTSITNFAMLGKLLGHFGGMQDALVRAEENVFQAAYHSVPTRKVLYNRHGELEDAAVIVDWYDLPADWFQTAGEKIDREGTAYFYTRTADSARLQELRKTGYSVTLWRRYDFLDAKPLFFRAAKMILKFKGPFQKTKKENAILIYLVRREPS